MKELKSTSSANRLLLELPLPLPCTQAKLQIFDENMLVERLRGARHQSQAPVILGDEVVLQR